ncbi:V-type proton ATPase subunit e [Biomphalaria glabrata]|uniref:V-type proton ATPase subunit e-like n=1 Tax=Biomphalaria glabrata TaxID=6526 RepID=A0A2C9KN64_BIOGL|nr:V-type proton ATPase subunit e-like [Biomphalaria glabrata]KAI8769840.1 V-type proton ATPase subunit e-like [Biomphalaria glabrata]KAI8774551.1 V-type proton ATPase subunit e [Biomphalaria glabrata]
MSETAVSLGVICGFWAFIAIICPILIQFLMAKSPNKGIVQICLVLTGVCCFIFWIVTFFAQLNPLIGPQLHTDLIRWILIEWYDEAPWAHEHAK